MAKVAITEQYLEDIADAIRSKTGLSNTYLPSEMAEAILTISGGGGIVPSGTKTINISSAGTTTEDVTQYASAQIVVPAGTAGMPTATKSVVSGNKLTVTPSVTNVAGFISGGSVYGTAVQVAASELVSGTLEITTNGTKDVTNYASVEVAVPTGSTINNQDKSVTPTTSQQTITADSGQGYTGLGTVTVYAMPSMTLPTSADSSATSGFSSKATISRSTADQYINIPTGYNAAGAYYKVSAVPNGTAGTPTATKGTVSNHSVSVTPSVTNTTGYITGSTKTGTAVTVSASELVSGTLSVTSNGTKDVTNYASISVNVPTGGGDPTIESLDITPTESEQTYNSSSVDGYKPVTVSAISSTYVGSGITQRDSDDLTASGATITAPAGYYSAAASKSVTTMTLPTSAASSATSGYTSKATISRSTSAQYINIPPGYNSVGGYYVISAVANGSASAPTTISGTSATVSTGTNTLTLTKTVSVTPVVSAGYVSSGTATNSSVSLTASVTVNPTPTASGATVTIPAGYYSSQTTKSVTSGSATGPSSLSGTSATVSTGTNTLTLTKTNVTTTPTVSAGYVSSATASTATVTLTASVTTKAAATITPSTTNQTIAAGTYLTGIQTIAGDSDLVGSNIVSGASIFGVDGTVVLQNFYTGSSAPSSSTGSNGDIYLQT